MSSANQNVIRWFESAELDAPHLRSPQPCKRGIHCDYKLKDEASGELVRACCSGVHPGEEGTGRRLFPARITEDGREQPACVRLTGAAYSFYERRRLRLSWAEWCEQHEVPFTPALPGQPFEPVVRSPLGKREQREQRQETPESMAEAKAKAEWEYELSLALEPFGGREYRAPRPEAEAQAQAQPHAQPQRKLTKNERKRRNKKARLPAAAGTAEVAAEDEEEERLSAHYDAAYAQPELITCDELEAGLLAAHSRQSQVVPPPALDLASAVRDMIASGVSMANCELPSPGLPLGPPAPADDDGGKTPCLAGTEQGTEYEEQD
jgi:hypothetical protein